MSNPLSGYVLAFTQDACRHLGDHRKVVDQSMAQLLADFANQKITLKKGSLSVVLDGDDAVVITHPRVPDGGLCAMPTPW